MSFSRLALNYPVVIRLIDNYLVLSSPDMSVTITEELPPGGIDPKWMLRKVSELYGKAWVKNADQLKRFKEAGKKPPEPSRMKVMVKDKEAVDKFEERKRLKTKPLTAPEVAKILKVSENSVRRISKRLLPYWKTRPGGKGSGHRRYSIGAVKKYQETLRGETESPGLDDGEQANDAAN